MVADADPNIVYRLLSRKKLILEGTDLEMVAVTTLSLFRSVHLDFPPFGSIRCRSFQKGIPPKMGICVPYDARCIYRHG